MPSSGEFRQQAHPSATRAMPATRAAGTTPLVSASPSKSSPTTEGTLSSAKPVATSPTAAAAGNVAGLVLTAPVAVLDADTRGNYANHVGGLTGQTSGKQKIAVKNCAATPANRACRKQ
jgi:hypothetical protein